LGGCSIAGRSRHGFGSDRWTLKRIARLIWRHFRVRYQFRYLERPLKALGFSVQYAVVRARERDEFIIARWPHEEWVELKKSAPAAPHAAYRGVFRGASRGFRQLFPARLRP